jgi:hypothetical protein
MVTNEEIEATRKKSAELEAEFEELLKEALDPAKSLTPLLARLDEQCERLTEALKKAAGSSPKDPSIDYVAETAELFADWCGLEMAAAEGLESVGANVATPASRPRPAGQRRGGMRI